MDVWPFLNKLASYQSQYWSTRGFDLSMFIAVIARNDIVDIYSESMISSGHHLNYKYNKLYNKIDGLGSLVLLLISPRVDQYCDW
jgi:hypothetical protein